MPAVLFGGALVLRSGPSAAGGSGPKNPGLVPSAESGQALGEVEGFDANSYSVGRRDLSAKTIPDPTLGSSASLPRGQSSEQRSTNQVSGGLGRGELFFKMMFSVVLVIMLGAAAFYMSKKVLPRITNLPGKEIRILETAHLGPRKAVHLVKIGSQRLLIGSTNESISMLADVTEQDEPDLGESASAADRRLCERIDVC